MACKSGMVHGETDDMGYEIVKDPVEVRDLHATILCLLGFDYQKLNYAIRALIRKLTGRQAGACRVRNPGIAGLLGRWLVRLLEHVACRHRFISAAWPWRPRWGSRPPCCWRPAFAHTVLQLAGLESVLQASAELLLYGCVLRHCSMPIARDAMGPRGRREVCAWTALPAPCVAVSTAP